MSPLESDLPLVDEKLLSGEALIKAAKSAKHKSRAYSTAAKKVSVIGTSLGLTSVIAGFAISVLASTGIYFALPVAFVATCASIGTGFLIAAPIVLITTVAFAIIFLFLHSITDLKLKLLQEAEKCEKGLRNIVIKFTERWNKQKLQTDSGMFFINNSGCKQIINTWTTKDRIIEEQEVGNLVEFEKVLMELHQYEITKVEKIAINTFIAYPSTENKSKLDEATKLKVDVNDHYQKLLQKVSDARVFDVRELHENFEKEKLKNAVSSKTTAAKKAYDEGMKLLDEKEKGLVCFRDSHDDDIC